MGKYYIEKEKLYIKNVPVPNAAYIVIGIIGVIFLSISIYFIFKLALSRHTYGAFIYIFLTVLGLFSTIMITTWLGNSRGQFKELITFDNHLEKVSFLMSSYSRKAYDINYVSISYLTAAKISVHKNQNSSTGNRRFVYCPYLIKKDGSEIWLSSFSSPGKMANAIKKIANYTGFEVRDNQGLNIKQKPGKEFSLTVKEKKWHVSSFLLEQATSNGKFFKIKPENKTLGEQVVILAASGAFFLVPSYFIYEAIAGLFGGGDISVFGVIIAIIFISFSLLFISLFFFLFLIVRNKRFSIIIQKELIKVNLSFPFKIISKKLHREIVIPKETVKYVRVNRGVNGHFFLSLGLKKSFKKIPLILSLLINSGPFKKSGALSKNQRKENTLQLWDVYATKPSYRSLTIDDLHYIESSIENTIELNEESI